MTKKKTTKKKPKGLFFNCRFCKKPIEEPGALFVTPPYEKDDPETVGKLHLCVECSDRVLKILQSKEKFKMPWKKRGEGSYEAWMDAYYFYAWYPDNAQEDNDFWTLEVRWMDGPDSELNAQIPGLASLNECKEIAEFLEKYF